MNALEAISNSSIKSEVPSFEIGDTVKVHVKIKEGDKSRIQVFEGTVIAKNQRNLYCKTCSTRLRNRKSIPSSLTCC